MPRIILQALGVCLLLAGAILILAGLAAGIAAPMTSHAAPPECPSCGYDLQGLPGRRCPECGWKFRSRRRAFGDSLARLGLNRADRQLTLGAASFIAGLAVLLLV